MNARSRLLWTAALTTALALAPATPARAAEVDPATVSAARAIAEQGLDLFDRGQYAAALDKFERADELIDAPTVGLYAARCLEQLGRLVEASERYLHVSRMPLDASASDVFEAAIADAGKAYKDLKARVPRLAVTVRGAPEREVQITIDGKPVPPALVGVGRPVDPGRHVVEGAWSGRVIRREISLPERNEATVTLEFAAGITPPAAGITPPAAGAAPAAGATGAGPAARTAPAAGITPGIAHRALGWTAVGTGAAGLVVGGITFGVASALQRDLFRLGCTRKVECPDTPATRDKLSSYNTVRLVPAPAFIAGGVLAAGGIALLFTAPSAPKPRGATARPWISPWGAGLEGVF